MCIYIDEDAKGGEQASFRAREAPARTAGESRRGGGEGDTSGEGKTQKRCQGREKFTEWFLWMEKSPCLICQVLDHPG